MMLEDMKTRQDAERYIDEILDNPDYYTFENNDPVREQIRNSRLRDWEEVQARREREGVQLQEHISKNWDEGGFKGSFKNWEEMNVLEKVFVRAVEFLEGESLDRSITRASLMDKVVERANEILPEIHNTNSVSEQLQAYQKAIDEAGLRNFFSVDDVMMYANQQQEENEEICTPV